ncbi:carboxymuconolactone decarboxylase family protein [Microbulbifer epialgicus]|uniref:Carboxymuconolactone decarboxylase family protein n=1 Tax=Microbulbifer epialgicus TaxID=393907 RepID=A0ABV4P1D8_9GAMM
MSNFSFLRPEASPQEIFGHLHDSGPSILRTFESAMRGPSELSPGERELIAVFISSINRCRYCYLSHAEVARAYGEADDLIEAALSGVISQFPKKLQVIFSLAKKVTLNAHSISRNDIESFVVGGWKEQTALDVIFVVSCFSLINCLVSAAGIEPLSHQGNVEAGQFLAQNGYYQERQ